MKKKIIIISIFVIVVIVAISIYFFIKNKNNYQSKTITVTSPTEITETEVSPTESIESNDDTNPTTNTSFSYACPKGKTIFESLLSINNNIEYSENSSGTIITSIGGITETETLKWQFKMDGKYAEFPSNAYTCLGNEHIIWELNQI